VVCSFYCNYCGFGPAIQDPMLSGRVRVIYLLAFSRSPPPFQTELLHLVPKGVVGDVQELRGLRLVAVGLVQRLKDDIPLQIIQGNACVRQYKLPSLRQDLTFRSAAQ